MNKYDVFISCKSEDYHYAVPIYYFLTTNGLKVFLADVELRAKGRDVYGEIIDAALESAEHLVVFASKAEYVESTYVKSEWRTFVEEKRSGRKEGNIITILKGVQIANLPIALRSFQSFKYAEYKDSLAYLQVSRVKPDPTPIPARRPRLRSKPMPTPEPMPAPALAPKPVPTPKSKFSLKWVWALVAVLLCGILLVLIFGSNNTFPRLVTLRSRIAMALISIDNSTPYVEELPIAVEIEQIDAISTESNEPESLSENISNENIDTQNKTYQVGDYYNQNGKEGVVFEVSEDGLHGKIVSLTQSSKRLRWLSELVAPSEYAGKGSRGDGWENSKTIMQISNWQSHYPALDWCEDLGEGWYLPAIEELGVLCDGAIYDKVNMRLQELNATQLLEQDDYDTGYWSSTEYIETREEYDGYGIVQVYMWNMAVGAALADLDYWQYITYVRAVSTF